MTIVRLQGFGQSKNQMTLSGIQEATFRRVVECRVVPQLTTLLRTHTQGVYCANLQEFISQG
jgi:hypothetical protein